MNSDLIGRGIGANYSLVTIFVAFYEEKVTTLQG